MESVGNLRNGSLSGLEYGNERTRNKNIIQIVNRSMIDNNISGPIDILRKAQLGTCFNSKEQIGRIIDVRKAAHPNG